MSNYIDIHLYNSISLKLKVSFFLFEREYLPYSCTHIQILFFFYS